MLPSNRQITAWLREGQEEGALELLVGLDTYFLTPTGAEPQDDDYFKVFIMPGDDREAVVAEAFEDPHRNRQATYRVPKSTEEISESGVQAVQTQNTGHVPTYLVNNALFPNRFGKRN